MSRNQCFSVSVFLLEQLFLFDLQLQHDCIELHVEVVGSLQFPLIVLPNVQCMPVGQGQSTEGHKYTDVHLLLLPRFICLHDSVVFQGVGPTVPELFSAPFDQLLVQPVETRPLRLDLLKVVPHLVSPLRLGRHIKHVLFSLFHN